LSACYYVLKARSKHASHVTYIRRDVDDVTDCARRTCDITAYTALALTCVRVTLELSVFNALPTHDI